MNMYLDKTQYETTLELSLYIEGLLQTDELEVKPEIDTKIQENIETILLNDLVIPELDVQVDVAEAMPLQKLEDVSEIKTEQNIETRTKIPLWAEDSFKCLLVKSSGMSFMIPAMSISYIERIDKKIIRLPLDVEAFRGVVTLRERSVAIIDLFTLISENASNDIQTASQIDESHVEHVIVMDDGQYALACEEVGELVTLESDDVRWNKASFSNPMFAGIVSEYLCTIVNIDYVQQQVAAMPFVQSLNSNYQ